MALLGLCQLLFNPSASFDRFLHLNLLLGLLGSILLHLLRGPSFLGPDLQHIGSGTFLFCIQINLYESKLSTKNTIRNLPEVCLTFSKMALILGSISMY